MRCYRHTLNSWFGNQSWTHCNRRRNGYCKRYKSHCWGTLIEINLPRSKYYIRKQVVIWPPVFCLWLFYGEPPFPFRVDSLQCKKHIMPERKFFEIESWKWKIENCGRADSLQNANHCCPTVFVYIEVAFKCMGGYHPPARLPLLQKLRIRNCSVRHGVACVPE